MYLENSPELWIEEFPVPDTQGHKYDRGHALIYGAVELTGATRLAAESCSRVGAGLTTVLSASQTEFYRSVLPAHVIVRDDVAWYDAYVTARLYGPGGLPVPVDYDSDVATILDADALRHLPYRLAPNFVLTPHEGEFQRICPDMKGLERVEAVIEAAKKWDCVFLLKGAETVIASATGQCVISKHATPYLASAGTGDVLAGLITGLCAQGMEPFLATCAAAWMHGEAGIRVGPGLVASDIPDVIPEIMRNFA